MKTLKSLKRAFTAHLSETLIFLFMFIVGVLLLFPLYYALFGSVSTPIEFSDSLWLPIPKTPFKQFKENYFFLFAQKELLRSLVVTLIRFAWSFFISAVTSIFGGYVFAQMNFPYKNKIFLAMLATTTIPGVAMTIPSYIWISKFPLFGGNNIIGEGGTGLLNNPWYFFITGWVSVMNIFLFRQAFAGIGSELRESAELDGANFFTVVIRIYTPIIAPMLVVLGLNQFIGVWNDYQTNLIYCPDNTEWYTIGYYTIGLADYYGSFSGNYDYPKAFAILMIMMVPPTVLFCCFQNKFLEGLTSGSIKF